MSRSPRKALAKPPATHTELLTWQHPPALPSDDRIVLLALADGTVWPAWWQADSGVWLDAATAGEIDATTVQRWADMPTGQAYQLPAISPTAANAGEQVARLDKTPQGYLDLHFTAAGKALPPGSYRLCAITPSPEPTL